MSESTALLDLPAEILLYILSYLDLPDLTTLTQVAPALAPLTSDPVLHSNRLRIVSPSRVNHNLFGTSPQGHALRPTVGDLVQRGVMRGLNIERRWRMGNYFYSRSSIIQYETGCFLVRHHASHVLSTQLLRRSTTSPGTAWQSLHHLHVLPDVESSSPAIARSLLPVMRQLKWSIQRDHLARLVKTGPWGGRTGFAAWLENRGKGVVQEGEKVRLAVCPDIRKKVGFYEMLCKSA